MRLVLKYSFICVGFCFGRNLFGLVELEKWIDFVGHPVFVEHHVLFLFRVHIYIMYGSKPIHYIVGLGRGYTYVVILLSLHVCISLRLLLHIITSLTTYHYVSYYISLSAQYLCGIGWGGGWLLCWRRGCL